MISYQIMAWNTAILSLQLITDLLEYSTGRLHVVLIETGRAVLVEIVKVP